MADLDDFFAKKDRKKGKTVKKFSTSEELAKKLEDTKQKNEQKVRKDRQPVQGQDGEDGGAMPGDEDEWREYEVAKKDYTGLKIQPLSAAEANAGQGGGGGGQGGEGGSGGQGGGPGGAYGKPGPWNKNDQEGGKAEEPPPKPVVVSLPVVKEPAPSSGGYVPPSLRNRQAQQPDAAKLRHGKMHAPDIHSEEYFPTLGGDKKAGAGGAGGGAWTEAGGGGGGVRGGRPPPTAASREVPLGNRFTSLTNDS